MTKSRNILAPRTKWTDEMLEILRSRYPHEKTSKIADDLGVQLERVYRKAKKMGLSKTEEYLASPDACRLRRDNSGGIPYRFKKGQLPPNKGLRRPGYAPGRMAESQFKKGSAPHNTHEVGSYRITRDGTLQRKIGNAKGSNSKRWRGVHELVWIEANGPVPPKHIVVFKPGMRTNVLEEITIDKVECISLAENMRRNTYHNRYPKEIGLAIQMRGALTRRINKLTRQEESEHGTTEK